MHSGTFGALLQIAELDRTVHEPARLLILAMLNVVDSADFVFLHQQSGLTRGNFSTHISKLEEEKYIEVRKDFVDKKSVTAYSISKTGRKALNTYREHMQRILAELD